MNYGAEILGDGAPGPKRDYFKPHHPKEIVNDEEDASEIEADKNDTVPIDDKTTEDETPDKPQNEEKPDEPIEMKPSKDIEPTVPASHGR